MARCTKTLVGVVQSIFEYCWSHFYGSFGVTMGIRPIFKTLCNTFRLLAFIRRPFQRGWILHLYFERGLATLETERIK
jgi:hypothetical protein